MAKLIITMNGGSRQEFPLDCERLTIGRATHNDVVIDHPGVSAEHALIVTLRDDALLQDLASTNGTMVNGQPVMRHFLQDGDVIELADCEIVYVMGVDACANPGHQVPFLSQDADGRSLTAPTDAMPISRPLQLKVLNGASAGKTFMLTKPLMTLGRPGIQVAAIASLPEGPVLLHVEGNSFPILNGRSVDESICRLQSQDVVELSGTQIQLLEAVE